MSHYKLKTFVFGTVLAFGVSSCGNLFDDKPKTRHVNERDLPRVKAEDEATAKRRNQEQQKVYDFRQHIFDSVMTVNGGAGYGVRLNANRSWYSDEREIEDLKREYSLGGVMTNKVIEFGLQIIDKSYQDIASELSKYKINLNDYIEQTKYPEDPYSYFRAKDGVVQYPELFFKPDMCFIGVVNKDAKYEGMADYYWDGFQSLIDDIIDKSEYDIGQKNTIKIKIKHIINKTKRNLIANRQSIEKQYSDYYLLDDYGKQYLGLSWGGEGSYIYGYEDLNNDAINGKYIVSMRSIHVYDSKLNVDFFGDKNATYKLVSLGNYKWQVIKRNKSGQIEKTPVFSDKREYTQYRKAESEKPDVLSYFNFEPGENIGVHIEFDEVVDVKQRKKDWIPKMPKDIQNIVDSLSQEVARKDELQSLFWAASHQADSIAKQMTLDEYGVLVR